MPRPRPAPLPCGSAAPDLDMGTFATIAPLFLVILTGFTAVRTGYVRAEALRPMGEVVLRIALPVLIFLSVAGASTGRGLQPNALLAIGAGSLAAFAFGLSVALVVSRMPLPQAAMIGLGAAASNSGFIGYPVAQQLFGTAEAGHLLAHMMIVENLLIIPLALILCSGSGKGVLNDLTRNPLILSLGIAVAFRMTGAELPLAAKDTLELLARMSAPMALLVVGATLAAPLSGGHFGGVLWILVGKLLVHPACTFAAFKVSGDFSAPFVLGAVLFAAMPMVSVYPILC
jgi:malonate transporter and related proteins